MRTIKGILKKNEDPYLGLLQHRAMPLENGYSPAELLMGRVLQGRIPMAGEELLPKLVDLGDLRRREEEKREKSRKNFNKRHRARVPMLVPGENVWIRDRGEPGVVQSAAPQPRSYSIIPQSGGGETLRRNASALQALPQTTQEPDQQQQPEVSARQSLEDTTPAASPVVTRNGRTIATPAAGPVITRSGRIVKPPVRMDL